MEGLREIRPRLVRIDAVSVPGTIKPGESIRVHLDFRPAEIADWNNEAEPLRVWLEQPPAWKLERRLLESVPMPRTAESHETRRLEFEMQTSEAATSKTVLRGYATLLRLREIPGGLPVPTSRF